MNAEESLVATIAEKRNGMMDVGDLIGGGCVGGGRIMMPSSLLHFPN